MLQIENLRMSLLQAENELRTRDTEIRKSAEAERNINAQLQLQVSKLSSDNNKLQVSWALLYTDFCHACNF